MSTIKQIKVGGVTYDIIDTDTKNTAGATNTSSKIYLVGATAQTANPQTYTHDTAYVGTDGYLYSNGKKVDPDHTHSYVPLAGGSMNDGATLKFSLYGNQYVTIGGNSITADMSQVDGGWAGTFAGVKHKDSSTESGTATTTMLGWYGGGTGLTHIFMGGAYNDPAMKMTPAGNFTFKNQVALNAPQGTAPLAVTSTTKVTNLNADLLDGQDSSYYLNYNNFTNKPTIPEDTNSWRKVQLNGTDKLGTGINTKPLNIKAGSYMTITEKDGTFTFTGPSAADLGLSSAMKFLGSTITAIGDGFTTNPITVKVDGVDTSIAPAAGNVVLYGGYEYVWTGSAWEQLGQEGSFKVKQTAVSSPSASGSTTAFIDTISQDANGNITATKKNVQFPTIPTKSSWNYDDRYVRYDTSSQGLNATQKANARTNIGAISGVAAEPGDKINSVGTPSVTASTSNGVTTLTFNYLKGATGAKGDTGKSSVWHIGTAISSTDNNISVAASTINATTGDMYLNTSNYNVYKCINETGTNRIWSYACNIKGAPGSNGNTGASITDVTITKV